MIPLRDDNPTIMTPVVTVALIATNVALWMYVQGGGLSEVALADSVCNYGAIPAEITGNTGDWEGVELVEGMPPCKFGGLTWHALLTSMFMHGGWLHLIGNMWFLWLFGDNINDSMGHTRFLIFYLLTGLAGSLVHVFMAADSLIPTVGASGAISGLMGGYLVLYPRARIQTLFILFVFIKIIPVPAWLVLGEWFAVQLLSGYGSVAGGAGVAFWAHIGGFVAGVLLVKVFENRRLVEARKKHIQLSPFEIPGRGWL